LSWTLYDELEKEELEDPANYTQADKNTVNRKKLHDKLVESGYFSNVDAEETIDEMIRMGRLEQVMMDTLRRR
jgi:polyhydroxyalkanoate synthesis regulator phasin